MGLVCINTTLSTTAGMGGAIAVIVVSRKRRGYLISSFNGVLAGLVAITAISEYCSPIGAVILGLIAGVASEHVMKLVTNKTVDDVVNVIPTHLCGSIVGCLFAPFLVVPEYMHHGVFAQFAVQLLGVVVNIAWAFTSAYLMFRIIDKLIGLRVSSEEEEQGLQFMVDNLEAIEGFRCTLQIDDPIPNFDDAVSLNIYRLIQEALTNVVRHAKASEAVMVCRQLSNSYYFEVRDNGIGFDLTKIIHGVGLDSMSDRIQMLGGTMQIHTQPGEGTTVTMELPLHEQ